MFPTQRTWHYIFSNLQGRFLNVSLKDSAFILDENSDKPCKEFIDDIDSFDAINEGCIQDKANVSVVARVTSANAKATKVTIGIAGFVDLLPIEETAFLSTEQDEYLQQCWDDMEEVYKKHVYKFVQGCERFFAKNKPVDDFVIVKSTVDSEFDITEDSKSAFYEVRINLVLQPK